MDATSSPRPDLLTQLFTHTFVTCSAFLNLFLSRYMDVHLLIPVMEFIEMGPDPENPKPVLGYQAIDIQKARLELVKPTNMTEYATRHADC